MILSKKNLNMKIALIGYGKMGHEIEAIARERGHEIPVIIDINNGTALSRENLQKAEVAIDFSTPQSAVPNIFECFEAGIPVVCGTTGWHEQLPKVEQV